jgi:DNA gyrase/topoisomerase IV subunit A
MIYCPEEKTGELVGAITVRDDDDVVVITSQGKTIKFAAETVNVLGKAARGVRIVNIDRPDFVIALDRVAREEETIEEVEGAEAADIGNEAGVASVPAAGNDLDPTGDVPVLTEPSDEPREDEEDAAEAKPAAEDEDSE